MRNEKLRAARKKRLWSIDAASKKIGVSALTYSRWENGEQNPHLSSLELLCKAFASSPDELGFAHLVEPPSVAIKEVAVVQEISSVLDVRKSNMVAEVLVDEQEGMASFQPLGDTMSQFDPTRRTLLQQMVGTTIALSAANLEPLERLSSALRKPSSMNEATILHFEKLTELCWELSSGTELSTAGQILSTYLPKLIRLSQQPSQYQKKAASIVGQGLQLTSIVAAHRLDLSSKEAYCQQAVEYGKLAEDRNVQVASMIELAVAFLYNQQIGMALQTFRETLLYVDQISPLMRARVYIGMGEAYARYGHKQEALRYLGMAYEVFPEQAESDPCFFPADCPRSLLALYEGLAHLHLDQPEEAWRAFTSIEKLPPSAMAPERIRLEVVNNQALAAIALKDIERSYTSVLDGVTGSLALGSEKRYNEANAAYKQMRLLWPNEPRVKMLEELFQR